MKNILFIVVLAVLSGTGQADTLPAALPYHAPYDQLKAWQQACEKLTLTREQWVEVNLKAPARVAIGDRGLKQVFGDFAGNRAMNPGTPGLKQTARLMASNNPSQAKGYLRAMIYAQGIDTHPKWKLEAMNQPQVGPEGKTDRDLVMRHRATGATLRIESKEVRPDSQTRNLAKYKTQLDKMYADFRRTGNRQVLINKYEVVEPLKRYAAKLGIPVYEKVGVGRSPAVARNLDDVLNTEARVANLRRASIARVAGLGFGLVTVVQTTPVFARDLEAALNNGFEDPRLVRQLARSGMLLSGGSAMAAGALSHLAGWSRAGRVLGPAGLVFAAGSQVMLYLQYRHGDITPRTFWTETGSLNGGLVGGLAGAWAGGKAGAALGSWFGPWGTAIGGAVGGVGGGVAGAWGGSKIARSAVGRLFDLKDEAHQRELERHVMDLYSRQPAP